MNKAETRVERSTTPAPVATAPSSAEPKPVKRRNPERTRDRLMKAAIAEFADKGLGGARVAEIAARAGANKRMLYHYFGNKESLYLAVLENTYDQIRQAETMLRLSELDPEAGMRRLVEFSFDYYTKNPYFIRILDNENLQKARNLKRSSSIRQRNSPIIAAIEDLLARGERSGVFRSGVDPVQLYISIAGLGYFYFANIYTLSQVFGQPFSSKALKAARRQHAGDVILGFLKPHAPRK